MKILSSIRFSFIFIALLLFPFLISAQGAWWQQHVSYEMEILMDVNTHRFTGKQKLTYHNNSPDTLDKVYYHLFLNAFQPGSAMDMRSRTIADPDSRVGDRISKLKDSEIGYQRVRTLKQDSRDTKFKTSGTILEVVLNKPIPPGGKTKLEMEFDAQVPLQIRRNGRMSAEGIDYSMAQWYPKLAEYDWEGWHAYPYIGREFHGVWGDFDVKITIDAKYTVAGTGYLQNPQEIGHGYGTVNDRKKRKDNLLTWHFVAKDVHDFMWAADPDYVHTTIQVPDGPLLRFFYDPKSATVDNWKKLPEMTSKAFQYMNKHFGKYPYDQYSVIQGGDGGMEYPMATLITGNRNMVSLLGVTIHELVHSWFQGVLATNEGLHSWMDEGFTVFATNLAMRHVLGTDSQENPHESAYQSYLNNARSGKEEPLTTHSDRYHSNRSYGINAYNKGCVILSQLGYVIGDETLMRGMRSYFETWKFKHPTPTDFRRVMEKNSGMLLDWYFHDWVSTTNTLDYGISSVNSASDKTIVTVENFGTAIMPMEVLIITKDNRRELHYIPLRVMRGIKQPEYTGLKWINHEPWPWTYPSYSFEVSIPLENIQSIVLDPSGRIVDINPENQVWSPDQKPVPFKDPTQ